MVTDGCQGNWWFLWLLMIRHTWNIYRKIYPFFCGLSFFFPSVKGGGWIQHIYILLWTSFRVVKQIWQTTKIGHQTKLSMNNTVLKKIWDPFGCPSDKCCPLQILIHYINDQFSINSNNNSPTPMDPPLKYGIIYSFITFFKFSNLSFNHNICKIKIKSLHSKKKILNKDRYL